MIANRYSISKKINRGSFGEIFLGTDTQTTNNIVIKRINKRNYGTKHKEPFDIKIKREIEIPKLLSHKNIIRISDTYEDTQFTYIIYPYITNARSMAHLKKSEINFKDKNTLTKMLGNLWDIADAIEYMHSKGIVHRDIKPENIIVGDDKAVLIDFDLSSIMDDPFLFPKSGYVGSPYYMAPEIFRRDDNIDYYLTDVYSFGVTIYYIFNKGNLPYYVSEIGALEELVLYNKPVPSVSQFKILNVLIMSIINKNPPERPSLYDIKLQLKTISNQL